MSAIVSSYVQYEATSSPRLFKVERRVDLNHQAPRTTEFQNDITGS